jgi:hypothetical protein
MVALCEEFLGLLDDVGSKLIWLFIDFSNPNGEDNKCSPATARILTSKDAHHG